MPHYHEHRSAAAGTEYDFVGSYATAARGHYTTQPSSVVIGPPHRYRNIHDTAYQQRPTAYFRPGYGCSAGYNNLLSCGGSCCGGAGGYCTLAAYGKCCTKRQMYHNSNGGYKA
jgi:hypothetical protein